MPNRTDPVAQITADHRHVQELFDDFEKLTPRAIKGMGELRDRIVRELSVHAAIEERVLYPIAIDCIPEMEEQILEGMKEHAIAESLLAQVAHMPTDDRWFRPTMSVLIESVRHHIEEEESDILPRIEDALADDELAALAEALDDARATAPEMPPPGSQARALLEQVTQRAQELLHRIGSRVGV